MSVVVAGTDDVSAHHDAEPLGITKRSKVVKITFSGKEQNVLEKVSRDVYGYVEMLPEVAAVDQNWTTTDESLYGPARSVYDSIVAPFLREPKVYRFESTKLKIWADRERLLLEQLPPPEPEPEETEPVLGQFKSGKKRNKFGKIVKVKSKVQVAAESEQKRIEAVRLMDPLETYLDPFEVQKPWREKKNNDGSIYYFNEETKEATDIFPGEAWLSRLKLLDHLVPKDDFSGYEYNETLDERFERLKAQSSYARKLQDEIRRRLEDPTELEQVEDALFDIVDSVVKTDERAQKLKRRREKTRLNRLRNPAVRDYEMIPLKVQHEQKESADDKEDVAPVMLVTDVDFTDLIITPSGLMLPLTAPTELLLRHEAARELREKVLEEIKRYQQKLWVQYGGDSLVAAAREINRKVKNPLRPVSAPSRRRGHGVAATAAAAAGGGGLISNRISDANSYSSLLGRSIKEAAAPPSQKQMSLYENARLVLAIARNDPGKALLKVAEGIGSAISGRPAPTEGGEDSRLTLRRGMKSLNVDTAAAAFSQSKDAMHHGMAGLLQLQSQFQSRASPLHNKLRAMSPAFRRLEERGEKLRAAGEEYWKDKKQDWAPAIEELKEFASGNKLKLRMLAKGAADEALKGARGALALAIEKSEELNRMLAEEDSDDESSDMLSVSMSSVSLRSRGGGSVGIGGGGSIASMRRLRKERELQQQQLASKKKRSLISNPSAKTQKLDHVDAVLITVTALLDPPPHWVRTPLKSLADDLQDGVTAIGEALKRKFGVPSTVNPLLSFQPSSPMKKNAADSNDNNVDRPSHSRPTAEAAAFTGRVDNTKKGGGGEEVSVPMVGVGGRPGIYTYNQWKEKHFPPKEQQQQQPTVAVNETNNVVADVDDDDGAPAADAASPNTAGADVVLSPGAADEEEEGSQAEGGDDDGQDADNVNDGDNDDVGDGCMDTETDAKLKKIPKARRSIFQSNGNRFFKKSTSNLGAATAATGAAGEEGAEKEEKEKEEGEAPATSFIDTSHRVEFEEQLIKDMAYATSLPPENISIEQIRRLDVNSHILLDLQKRNQQIYESLQIAQEEGKRLQAEREKERMGTATATATATANKSGGYSTTGNGGTAQQFASTTQQATYYSVTKDNESQLQLQKGLSQMQQDIETRTALGELMDELVAKDEGHCHSASDGNTNGIVAVNNNESMHGSQGVTAIAAATSSAVSAITIPGNSTAPPASGVDNDSSSGSRPSDDALMTTGVVADDAHAGTANDTDARSHSKEKEQQGGATKEQGGATIKEEVLLVSSENNNNAAATSTSASPGPLIHHDRKDVNTITNTNDARDHTIGTTHGNTTITTTTGTSAEADYTNAMAIYGREHLEAAQAIKDAKLRRDRPPSEIVSVTSEDMRHILPQEGKNPEYFKVGLPNPSEDRSSDPSSWQAHALRKLTPAERRAYRIDALKKTSREHSLKARAQQELVNLMTSMRYNLMDLREDARSALEEGIVTAEETLANIRTLRQQLADTVKFDKTTSLGEIFHKGPGDIFNKGTGDIFNKGPGDIFNTGPGMLMNKLKLLPHNKPDTVNPAVSAAAAVEGNQNAADETKNGDEAATAAGAPIINASHIISTAADGMRLSASAPTGLLAAATVPIPVPVPVLGRLRGALAANKGRPSSAAIDQGGVAQLSANKGRPSAAIDQGGVAQLSAPAADESVAHNDGGHVHSSLTTAHPNANPNTNADRQWEPVTAAHRDVSAGAAAAGAAPAGAAAAGNSKIFSSATATAAATAAGLLSSTLQSAKKLQGAASAFVPGAAAAFVPGAGTAPTASVPAADEFADLGLVGCEITFSIFISEDQRARLGLQDMEAEDIAVLVSQQLFDSESPLQSGKYSRYFIDARYKLMNKRRIFSAWEDYWVHLIHPCFFGYSSAKFLKNKHPNMYDPDGPKDVRNRVAPGLLVLNPVDEIPRQGKLRFIDLDGEDRWSSARLGLGLRLKDDLDPIGWPDEKLTDFTSEARLLTDPQEQLLQLMNRVDRMDDNSSIGSSAVMNLILQMDEKMPKLYRPNMMKITEDDVDSLKRMKRRFERQYHDKMRPGLVDGVRLSLQQYEALKALEAADRIYRSARQWLNRVQRDKCELDPYDTGPMKFTAVSAAEYQGWVKEIAKEEFEKLRRHHSEVERIKALRQEEVDLKKVFGTQRSWLLRKLCECHPQPPKLAYAMQLEFNKVDATNNQLRIGLLSKGLEERVKRERLAQTMRVISEEKRTRRLFGFIIRWLDRVNDALHKDGRKSGAVLSQLARELHTDTVRALRSVEKEWKGGDGDDGLVVEESVVLDGGAVLAASMDLQQHVGVGDSFSAAASSSIFDYDSAVDDDNSSVNNNNPGGEGSVVVTVTDTSAATATAAPYTMAKVRKVHLLAFLEIARKMLAHVDRESRREHLRRDKQTNAEAELEKLRWERLVEEEKSRFSDGGTSKTREALLVAERQVEALLSVPVEISEEELGPPPPPFDPIFALTEEEVSTVRNLSWMQAMRTSPPIVACLHDIPTLQHGALARDELIQFASIMVELEPVHTRVTNELASRRAATLAGAREKRKQLEEIQRDLRRQRDEDNAEQIALDEDATEAEREAAREIVAKKREAAAAEAMKLLREEEAEQRRKRRQNAWVQAHQHRFISLPDVPPFCIICKERTHEFWVETRKTDEKQWKILFDIYTDQVLSEYADKIHRLLENGIKVSEFRNTDPPAALLCSFSPSTSSPDKSTDPASPTTTTAVSFPDDKSVPDTGTDPGADPMTDPHKIETPPPRSPHALPRSPHALPRSPHALPRSPHAAGKLKSKSYTNINSSGIVLPPPVRAIHINQGLAKLSLGPHSLPASVQKAGISLWTPRGKPLPVLVKAQEAIAREMRILAVLHDADTFEGDDEESLKGKDNGVGGVGLGLDGSQKSLVEKEKEKPLLGIAIRLWNWEDEHRGVFLGQVALNYDDLTNPPKGMRTYLLKPNSRCAAEAAAERMRLLEIRKQIRESRGEKQHPDEAAQEAEQEQKQRNLKVQGSLTVKVKSIKKDKATKQILWWRVEIIKAHNLPICDPHELTSAYCEVLWKGPAEKVDLETKQVLLSDWVSVGKTKRRDRTTEPEYAKLEGSTLDLPPIWSFGGADERGGALTGHWVARNYSKPKAIDQGSSDTAEPGQHRRLIKIHTLALAVLHLLALRRTAATINAEVRRLREIRSYLMAAEEEERLCMGAEEQDTRCVNMEEEMIKCRPFLETQIMYAKSFAQLLSLVQGPSQQLSRLVFMMASTLEAGGMNVVCRDPATGRRVNALVTPVLYPEDEAEMKRYVSVLLGRQHPILLRLFDFSVNQIRGFAYSGYTGIDERVAITVVDNCQGITLSNWLTQHRGNVSDEQFKAILLQVLEGLAALHADGLVHRNFHSDCIFVEPDEQEHQDDSTATLMSNPTEGFDDGKELQSAATGTTGTATSTDLKPPKGRRAVSKRPKLRGRAGMHFEGGPTVKIGDYWFLQNPRALGCVYSMGRADWGAPAKATAPPEAKSSNGKITPASDVYAFGMCVLHWSHSADVDMGQDKEKNTMKEKRAKKADGRVAGQDRARANLGVPMSPAAAADPVRSLTEILPKRWGKWLHMLLRMCLPKDPRHRASSEELASFLKEIEL